MPCIPTTVASLNGGVDVFPLTAQGRTERKDVYSNSRTPRVLGP